MMGHYTYHGLKQIFWSHFQESRRSRSRPSLLRLKILSSTCQSVQTDHTSDHELTMFTTQLLILFISIFSELS